MPNTDWSAWHDDYARPGSGVSRRLAAVRAQIERHLDGTEPHACRAVSACAGDGRDLLGVLAARQDADRVSALLVEQDEDLVARAVDLAAGLPSDIKVHLADAADSVVWTRHRRSPDLTPLIRQWFAAAGFEEVAFIAPRDDQWSVGVHRLVGDPRPLVPGAHWFTFFR